MPFLLIKNLPRYECLIEASKHFPDLDPSACEVFLHLMRAGDEAFRITDSHLAEHNLSQGRFMVLLLLHKFHGNTQPCTPAELADRSQVTRATMTGLIDTLERDGLVKREPALEDRRMMSVTLTSKGEKVLEKLLPVHFQRMAALMQSFSEDERRTLVRLLAKLLQQTSAMAPSSEAVAPPLSAS